MLGRVAQIVASRAWISLSVWRLKAPLMRPSVEACSDRWANRLRLAAPRRLTPRLASPPRNPASPMRPRQALCRLRCQRKAQRPRRVVRVVQRQRLARAVGLGCLSR